MQTQEFDVIVIGLGSVGAMSLWQLASTTDLKVAGIEQWGIGHIRGSYAGESRVFRTAYHEGSRYVPLLLRAHELWGELEKQSNRELFVRCGTLAIDAPGHPPFETTLESIRRYDLPHQHFTTDELRRTYPQHAVKDGTEAVLDLKGGGIRSEAAVLSAVSAARAAGATVLTKEGVVNITERGELLEIHTPYQRLRTARVVVATGSWSTILRPELSALLSIRTVPLTWFAPQDPARYSPDRFPTFLRDQDGVHMFGVPILDGFSIKVVSHTSTDEELRNPEELPASLPRTAQEEISRSATQFFPDLHPEPVRHSIHHEAWTPSRTPIVDLDPSGRIITIAGLSGHGFKFSPSLGQLACSLVLGRKDDLYSTDFSLQHQLDAIR